MKVAIIGYGKMGKEVESVAVERGHNIVARVDSPDDFNGEGFKLADVAIEFSTPETAVNNIIQCFDVNLPVVVGTTGWMTELDEIRTRCSEQQQSLLYASNFSIGVNILFELNRKLAILMNQQPMYHVDMEEIHHTEKKDAPSGTAISLANTIIENLERKSAWTIDSEGKEEEIHISSIREANVPGTHTIRYSSEIDTIELKHTAKGRKGFALGAVLAAEWLPGNTGTFTMKDLLKL